MKQIPGAADLNKDAETAKEKSEENLHTAKEDCSDDHTSIAPIIPDQIGEHEDSSETEYGEQISRVISDKCSIEADIHKETADPEEFEKITESIPKDHNQGGVIEPKSVDNSDNTDNLDEAVCYSPDSFYFNLKYVVCVPYQILYRIPEIFINIKFIYGADSGDYCP